jgi:RNA polymerase sigma factor (sigma-70 family)
MAATRFRALIGHIETFSGALCARQRSDQQLLEDFSARRDEPAFAELVARHGPMVLRVCRRMLHHQQDAEDAFQATFLVLAQCLGSIRQRESLSNWLHGVAYRTAMKAKRSAARRRNHEAVLRERTPPAAPSPTWDDVQAVLDEEIQRLPEVFRSTFVLCVLEGKPLATAAAELQCKEGTVASRLSRARQRLQQQLARRGVKLAALLAALCVAQSVGKAAVPRVLAQTAVRSGILATSVGTAAGLIPPHVAELATGVTREMFVKNTKIVTILLLAVSLIAAAAGVLTNQVLEADEKPAAQPAKPTAEPVKAAPETVEVSGRVLDPNGQPVAKARLYQPHWLTERPEVDSESEMIALGTTDGDGRFRVKLRRPGGSSRQTVRGDRIVAGGGGMMLPLSTLPQPTGADRQPLAILAAADGFGLNWTELPKDKEPSEVTVRLVKDQKVSGKLLDTEGHPVVGVTVAVKGVGGSVDDVVRAFDPGVRVPESTRTLAAQLNEVLRVTATDKEGRFEITGAGIDRFALIGVNSETSVLPNIFVATQADFDPKKLELNPRPGQAQLFGPTFECVVLPGRPVEGIVREVATGQPVVGAEVIGHAARQTAKAVTDDKGHYKLVGLPKTATYRLQVTPANGAPLLARNAEATDRPGLERVTCDVELLRGAIVKGRVTDKATGKGVECQVHCSLLPDNKFAGKLRELESHLQITSTDSDGRFSVVTLPGPNLLVVLAGANQIIGVNVHTYKSAQLDDADRKIVKLDEKLRGIATADGRPVNLKTVNAVKVLDLEEGAGAVTADLTLDPGKTMTIRLQDPDGKPLSGALAAGVADMPHAVVPLEDDTCRVFALDPERARQVAFLHPEKKLFAVVTVRGDEKEPPAVRLVAPAVVTGRLLDADGKPVAGASILPRYAETAVQMLAGRLERAPGVPKTDKNGLFRLEGVSPGIKVRFSYISDRQELIEEKDTDREPYKSGETANLGDLRVKPRPRPQ